MISSAACRLGARAFRLLSTRPVSTRPILVVGSVNADIVVQVDRLPAAGETTLSSDPQARVIPGGKGANQAVAAARLAGPSQLVQFVCQLGNDGHAAMLEAALEGNGLDLSGAGRVDSPSGQGLVFLQPDGALSSVVVAGSNAAWPAQAIAQMPGLEARVRSAAAVMLQREVPEHVNAAVAAAAASAGVPVLQDVGGEDRPIASELLPLLSYLLPNETELARLSGMPTGTEAEVLGAARALQARGARAVLVTLGANGALLLTEDGDIVRQPPCAVPGGAVVDETGAGDSFRAAFCVALVEGRRPSEALALAAAAGAIAVSRLGAIPSLPRREEADALASRLATPAAATAAAPSGSASSGAASSGAVQPLPLVSREPGAEALAGGHAAGAMRLDELRFASRLNSMKDRRDLCTDAAHTNDVLGWVARQGGVRGLTHVDFNYPQHLEAAGVSVEAARGALAAAGLGAGAICLRYPPKFRLGAMTHPDPALRAEAVALTVAAGRCGGQLGADELVVWSAYCGYDYALQVDYDALWERVVHSFQAVCDALPETKVSLEFKPTDENTRFFAVPSTGAALQLVSDVGRANMGLTLDIGHCLMAGENPAQSVAMVGGRGKLFGVQCNDGYGRLGAEDGLMFGSVNPRMALEFCTWLQKTAYRGHIYFDTFPGVVDPVAECEYNIQRFKALWAQAEQLRAAGMDGCLARHDALASLELQDQIRG